MRLQKSVFVEQVAGKYIIPLIAHWWGHMDMQLIHSQATIAAFGYLLCTQ